MPFGVHRDARQELELAFTFAFSAKLADEFPFRAELLYPVIPIISNINITPGAHRNPTRAAELTIFFTRRAELPHEFTFGIELLNTIMTSINNPHITRRISSHTRRLPTGQHQNQNPPNEENDFSSDAASPLAPGDCVSTTLPVLSL